MGDNLMSEDWLEVAQRERAMQDASFNGSQQYQLVPDALLGVRRVPINSAPAGLQHAFPPVDGCHCASCVMTRELKDHAKRVEANISAIAQRRYLVEAGAPAPADAVYVMLDPAAYEDMRTELFHLRADVARLERELAATERVETRPLWDESWQAQSFEVPVEHCDWIRRVFEVHQR